MTRKRFFQVCFLLLLYTVDTSFAAKRVKLEINGRERIPLSEIQKLHTGLSAKVDELALTAEISYNNRSVMIEADRKFFVMNSRQYTLQKSVLIQNGELWIPVEMIEDIFTLLRLPVNYRVTEKTIETEKAEKVNPFLPKASKNDSLLDFIVLDAGHGGRDPGAFGVSKVKEKDITLKMTRVVFQHLRKQFPGTRIYVTRSRDVFMSLEQRARIANSRMSREKFGIFISLHCNATLSPRVAGLEVYHLSLTESNRESRELLIRENNIADGRGYIEKLESMLINAQIQAESREFAEQLESALEKKIRGKTKSRGVKKADFAVLRGSLMPAVLVEMGYITHAGEARLLNSADFQKQFASGIENGIRQFLKHRPKI
ncbi:MAG: N-acetylmuramoyl-L-alanine amidase [Leptospiraceae bacterium]|nr:N-acetylmuramoyl-L-alanine amidase [Leptospiraceae bacterium]